MQAAYDLAFRISGPKLATEYRKSLLWNCGTPWAKRSMRSMCTRNLSTYCLSARSRFTIQDLVRDPKQSLVSNKSSLQKSSPWNVSSRIPSNYMSSSFSRKDESECPSRSKGLYKEENVKFPDYDYNQTPDCSQPIEEKCKSPPKEEVKEPAIKIRYRKCPPPPKLPKLPKYPKIPAPPPPPPCPKLPRLPKCPPPLRPPPPPPLPECPKLPKWPPEKKCPPAPACPPCPPPQPSCSSHEKSPACSEMKASSSHCEEASKVSSRQGSSKKDGKNIFSRLKNSKKDSTSRKISTYRYYRLEIPSCRKRYSRRFHTSAIALSKKSKSRSSKSNCTSVDKICSPKEEPCGTPCKSDKVECYPKKMKCTRKEGDKMKQQEKTNDCSDSCLPPGKCAILQVERPQKMKYVKPVCPPPRLTTPMPCPDVPRYASREVKLCVEPMPEMRRKVTCPPPPPLPKPPCEPAVLCPCPPPPKLHPGPCPCYHGRKEGIKLSITPTPCAAKDKYPCKKEPYYCPPKKKVCKVNEEDPCKKRKKPEK